MESSILKNRFFLYMTEFFSGMSVMAVELGASRLLAPYFSSSQIVWTIIIGTIMIAMALGNIYGGRSADKHPNPDRLYGRIFIAAVWIAAIPFIGKYIILAISGILVIAVNQNFLIWAAFAACMIIFVFPLFLLGTVTPSLAKYSMESLEDNASIVGTLGAFNTVGSIIGTFLPTFVTIPAVGTAATFFLFAGILLVLALVYFLKSMGGRKTLRKTGLPSILFFVFVFGSSDRFAFWEEHLLYEGESVYNYLQVKEDEEKISLSTNVLFGTQSVMMKESGLTGMYYDYALLAPFMADIEHKEEFHILILGMGTGTYASQCRRYFEHAQLEGVEIDEKIIDLSHQYFGLPKEIPVVHYDGRAFLNVNKEHYDVIMVDAYQDITIPFQMSSTEFFTLVQEHLTEDGIMVVNMNMRGKGDGTINQYLSDTIAGVFEEVYTIDVPYTTNRELFASCKTGSIETLKNNMTQTVNQELLEMTNRIYGNLQRYTPGEYCMTDDKAPVELLGMQAIDGLISEELEYYKEILKKDGIKGLLDSH